MADRIKGITIEIDGNTDKLSKALSGVNKEIKTTQQDLKDVEKLLKMDPGNLDLLKQKQGLLADAVKETKEKLDSLKEAQRQLDEKQVDKNSDSYMALQREIIETENKLKSATKELQNFSIAGEALKAVGDKIKGVGDNVTDVGKDLTKKLTVPLAGVAAGIVKTTADFDSSMSKVKAISGATDDEFQSLRDTARKWGSETKFSATEVADAFTYMGMAGWKSDQMTAGIGGVLNLAAASGEDLATTSDIVTDALTAMGLTADDTSHFVDVLAATSSNANTNVSLMGESFKYCAPTAGALGYTIDDLALAIGLAGNAGIKGSQAGTALNNIFTRMAKPTKDSADAMDRLGITIADEEGRMYSFREIMDKLRESFGHINMPVDEFNDNVALLNGYLEDGTITEKKYGDLLEELMMEAYGAEGAEKARAAAMLAGQRGMPALLALVNASAEDYDKLSGSIENCTGSAERMSAEMQDNLNGRFTELSSATQELAISFGDLMMPVLKDIVEAVHGVVDSLNSMDDSQKQTILTIALVIGAIGPILVIIGTVISSIGSIISAVGSFITIASTVIGVLGGPLTAAIAAVIAIIVLLATHWEQVKEIAKKAIEIIMENVTRFKEDTVQKFNEVKDKVTEFVTNMFETVKEKATNIKESIIEHVGAAVKYLEELPQKAIEWGRDLIGNFINGIKEKASKLIDAVSDIAEDIKDFLGFSEPKKGPLSNFHTYAPDMMELYSQGIKDNQAIVTSAVGGLAGTISSMMRGANTTANINLTSNLTLDGDVIAQSVNRQLGVML